MNHFHHLTYLQQISDIIEDKHKPLAAYYGHIAQKIAKNHVVHLNGADPNRLRHCSACQAPITCDNLKSRKGKIKVRCSICGWQCNYGVEKRSSRENQNPKQKNDVPVQANSST